MQQEGQANTEKLTESLYHVLKKYFPAWKNCTIRTVKLGEKTFGYVIYSEGKLIAAFKADPSAGHFFSLSKKDIPDVLRCLHESDPNFKVSAKALNRLVAQAKEWFFPPEHPAGGLKGPVNLVTFLARWRVLFLLTGQKAKWRTFFLLPSKKVSLDAFWDKFQEVCGDIPHKSPCDYYPTVLFPPHDSTNLPE